MEQRRRKVSVQWQIHEHLLWSLSHTPTWEVWRSEDSYYFGKSLSLTELKKFGRDHKILWRLQSAPKRAGVCVETGSVPDESTGGEPACLWD